MNFHSVAERDLWCTIRLVAEFELPARASNKTRLKTSLKPLNTCTVTEFKRRTNSGIQFQYFDIQNLRFSQNCIRLRNRFDHFETFSHIECVCPVETIYLWNEKSVTDKT